VRNVRKGWKAMNECPVCKKDLTQQLNHQLFGLLSGDKFEYECECGATLEINVVPIPEFEISVKEVKP
jgi:hypothetical protein